MLPQDRLNLCLNLLMHQIFRVKKYKITTVTSAMAKPSSEMWRGWLSTFVFVVHRVLWPRWCLDYFKSNHSPAIKIQDFFFGQLCSEQC